MLALLPLKPPRRPVGDVICHSVYTTALVDDAVGDAAQTDVLDGIVVGGHAVQNLNCKPATNGL